MSDSNKKLPKNVIKFDSIIKTKIDKMECRCGDEAKYRINERYKLVTCEICGKNVDAFTALLVIVKRLKNFYHNK
ncbi:Uncharacterised protein [Staphylococcus aureus]|nr:Uncharacterised protein [Staphylococcus aureus]CAC6908944.1 Uncharacterised protein [Staphylococcus aureus]CAC7100170.1 Uncharacterised protein [Staphylococcus aureus]CAC7154482.1 Uncharacterised protein [Staphylococcus aureus]CAC8677352.1 Uncharacterised protein [Staphylococcus aureus]